MLFNEVYGSYYDAVAAILRRAVEGRLTDRDLTALVRRHAFSESLLAIPRGMKGERWQLLHRDLTTPIRQAPAMPLTTLQKRWLKALLLDPRIRLFSPDTAGLEDVEPLFTPDMIVYFDRYGDGDDYTDPDYISRFQTVLHALRDGRDLFVRFESGRGSRVEITVTPRYLEYSEKDDRFRLAASGLRREWIINLSRVTDCEPALRQTPAPLRPQPLAALTFELTDTRNALERVLLHFSHLQKETERLDDIHYRVTLCYDSRDETEMVVRILSFGPMIRVTEPERFVALLRQRIGRQMQFAAYLPGNGDGNGVSWKAKGGDGHD